MKLANLSKILKCAGNDDAITMKSEDNGDTITFMFESQSAWGPGLRCTAWWCPVFGLLPVVRARAAARIVCGAAWTAQGTPRQAARLRWRQAGAGRRRLTACAPRSTRVQTRSG